MRVNVVAFSAVEYKAELAKAREGYVLRSDSDAEIAALKKQVEELKSSNETASKLAAEWREKAETTQSQLETERTTLGQLLNESKEEHAKLIAGVRRWTARIVGKFSGFLYLFSTRVTQSPSIS
jgi:hypothetical protein